MNLTAAEFSKIENAIMDLLDAGPMDINVLVKNLKQFKQADSWQVILFLQGEEKLHQNADDFVEKRKNRQA